MNRRTALILGVALMGVLIASVVCGAGLVAWGRLSNAMPSGAEADVNKHDRAEIVRLALEWALGDENVADYTLLMKEDTIVLSLDNISEDLVPELPGTDLEVMTPEEVQERANVQGDFMYLKLEDLDASRSSGQITAATAWAAAEDSQALYLRGGGCELKFEKQSDEWKLVGTGSCWIV